MIKPTDNAPDVAVNVLLVEDSNVDAIWVEELMRNINENYQLHTVTDGVKALGFLKREGIYETVPVPDLMILDLNMPRMDGMAVLEEMNQDDSPFKKIPVIILCGDKKMIADFKDFQDLLILGHFQKPIDQDELDKIIKAVVAHW